MLWHSNRLCLCKFNYYYNPIKSFLRTDMLPINWDLHERYFYNVGVLSYIGDYGLLFQDPKE